MTAFQIPVVSAPIAPEVVRGLCLVNNEFSEAPAPERSPSGVPKQSTGPIPTNWHATTTGTDERPSTSVFPVHKWSAAHGFDCQREHTSHQWPSKLEPSRF